MNEAKHFTKVPDQHFAEVKVSQNDNAYGVTWAEIVKNYLKTAYSGEDTQAEVEAFGKTYKVLRRTEVTAFYDKDGNTLFDVTNERLANEYEWLTSNLVSEVEENGEAEKEVAQSEPEETGEVHTEMDGVVAGNTQTSSVYIGIVGAITKLQEELKKAKEKEFTEPIIEYLIERCKDSESLASDICQNHKTWEKCYKYIYEQARKKAKGSSCAVRDDVVYEWAEDYYRKDDKAEEEKERKTKRKEESKKPDTVAKRAQEKTKKTADKARPDYDTTIKSNSDNRKLSTKEIAKDKKNTEKEARKKKLNELEGQMDLFSMMSL